MKKLFILPVILALMSFMLIDNTSLNQQKIDVYVKVMGEIDEVSQKLLLEKLSNLKSKSKKVVFSTLEAKEPYADYKLIVNVNKVIVSPDETITEQRSVQLLEEGINSRKNLSALATQNKREDKLYDGTIATYPSYTRIFIDYSLKKSCEMNVELQLLKNDSLEKSYKIQSKYLFFHKYTEENNGKNRIFNADEYKKSSSRYNNGNRKDFPSNEVMINETMKELNKEIKKTVKSIEFN